MHMHQSYHDPATEYSPESQPDTKPTSTIHSTTARYM